MIDNTSSATAETLDEPQEEVKPVRKPSNQAVYKRVRKPSNQAVYKRVCKWLANRTDWEKKMGRFALQRYAQDRSSVNNVPWPRSSNVRFQLSDMYIERKKPLYFKIIYNSENVCHFKALIEQNIPFAIGCEHYFDFIVKEKTDFEEELVFCIDALLQWGEVYVKTTWDQDKEVPCSQEINPIFIIAPPSATSLQKADEFVHVMQFTKKGLKRKFKHLKPSKVDDLFDGLQDPQKNDHDQANQVQDEYDREGINRSGDNGKVVIWEHHYTSDTGQKRLRTISPDAQDFDFEDDREYDDAYQGEWMVIQIRRELTNKNLHSSRGVCEVVAEGEHSLTSMWRAKHNAMTLYNAPICYAPNGGIPGSTQNVGLVPGVILPYKIEVAQMGAPPMSWDQEMANTQKQFEQRMSIFDSQIAEKSGNTRTAREVSALENLTSLSIDLETGIWRRGIRKVMRQQWRLIVANRPDSLMYYIGQEMKELPPDALNNEYMITVSGSAENINKEWMSKKATDLLKTAVNNPYANFGECYKNFLEINFPGQVQRFFTDPKESQYKDMKKAASDLTEMMIGFPLQAEPTDNHFVCAKIAHDFIQKHGITGEPLSSQQVTLISQYLASHREALKKTNPEQYAQLNEMLNQTDIQARQAMAVHGAIRNGASPRGTMQPPVTNGAPVMANGAQPEAFNV